MNQSRFLPVLCFLILVLLLAAPSLAAMVTCPDTCSCLLPAEAQKAGLSAYCSGTKTICDTDTQKNEKYCYTKAVVAKTTITTVPPPQGLTAFKPAAKTTPMTMPTTVVVSDFSVSATRLVPVSCPSGCVCAPEEKALGATVPLSLCGGKKTWCGNTAAGVSQYCYTLPETGGTTPAPVCPSGCICTSDEKAAAAGLSACGGKKTACDKDTSGAVLYCYSTAVSRVSVLSVPTVTGTTIPPVRQEQGSTCAAGCACLLPRDADAKGLKYCNGKQVTCTISSSASAAGSLETRYCYSMAAGSTSPAPVLIPAVMITPVIPAPVPCPSGCSCLDEATIRQNGYPFCGGNQTLCGYSKSTGKQYCARTGAAVAGSGASASASSAAGEGNVHSAIGGFFASLFGGQQTGVTVANSQVQWSYCRQMFGLEPCHGTCVNLTNDDENCGSCGHWCRSGEQCSGGICTNLISDPQNCGGFGNTCPEGAPCVEGYCSALGCLDSTLTNCGNSCVDLRYSRANCGSCGNACAASQVCNAGTCHACADSGEWYCPDPSWGSIECTDVSVDVNNCGSCQHACGDDQICSSGTCVTCPEGSARCQGRCADLSSSNTDCGRCGISCNVAAGQTCRDGVCTCSGDLASCGTRCSDLRSSATDCGLCGRTCSGSGQSCSDGRCLCSNSSLMACGDSCLDWRTNNLHCGRCGNACPRGTSCVNGQCECPGYAGGMRYCDGRCLDTDTDQDNCGRCGHACTGMTPYCHNGVCTVS